MCKDLEGQFVAKAFGTISQGVNKIVHMCAYVCVVVSLFGCATQSTSHNNSTGNIVTKSASVPDFNKPDTDFIKADFDVLASSFSDELAGKYVMIDGVFHSTGGRFYLKVDGSYKAYYDDLFYLQIGQGPSSGKNIQVVWGKEDKEFGRPLVKMKSNDKIKVYGYVLRRDEAWRSKNGTLNKGFEVPVVVLIRVAQTAP